MKRMMWLAFGGVATVVAASAEAVAAGTTGPRIEIAQAALSPVASGFDAARAGTIAHPRDFLGYADVRTLATALLGEDADRILYALTGPGGVERRGDVFVGDACHPDDCTLLQVLIVVDTAQRRVFLAWQNRMSEEFRPADRNWPIEGQDFLVGWRNAK